MLVIMVEVGDIVPHNVFFALLTAASQSHLIVAVLLKQDMLDCD